MTSDDPQDLTLAQLGRLAVLEPDAARAERHRARCRRAIARRQSPASGVARASRSIARVVEPVLVGAFCMAYLLAVIHDIVRVLDTR